jgi:heat shock protein HslJ
MPAGNSAGTYVGVGGKGGCNGYFGNVYAISENILRVYELVEKLTACFL